MKKDIVCIAGFAKVSSTEDNEVIVEGDVFKALGFIDSNTVFSISVVDSVLYPEGYILHISLNQLVNNFRRI